MSLGFHFIPNFLDFSVGAYQKTAAHDAFERPPHELFSSPDAIRLNHFVGSVAEQGEIELLLGLEALQRRYRVGARSKNGHAELFELGLCVAKLGRLNRSTRCVGLWKEEQQHVAACKIIQ